MKFEDKKIRVLGKGKTALALKERFKNSCLYDDSDFSTYDTSSEDLTIVSPGIPPYNEMIKKARNIQSDYDLFYEKMPLSIWISGTNGKTTTTQMTQHLLEEKDSVCGGNIGTPLSALDENKSIWILETSSFTLHYTKIARPNIYILLPISEDHISWHGSFEEYKKAKLKPLDLMSEGQIAIIPKEFEDYPSDAYKIVYENTDDLCKKFGIDKEKINFKEPFLQDAVLALSTKKILFDKIDYEKINTFKVDAHKIEEIKDKKGRLWINDSKATNIDATLKALIPYKDKKIHLILGGDDKGANLLPLFGDIKNLDIEIYAIGSNMHRIINFCNKFNIKSNSCEILDNAVKEISIKHDRKGVAVLSPAAASLDQFSSYAQRGDKFKKLLECLS